VTDEGIGPNFFDALHESASGTKRTYRRRLQFVRFRCEVDMRRSVASTASVANDPKQILGAFRYINFTDRVTYETFPNARCEAVGECFHCYLQRFRCCTRR
jgi:hypothetical protein